MGLSLMEPVKFNWFDRMVGYFSPESGLDRARARHRIRAYAGASKGRRTENWKATGLSAAAEVSAALPVLRDRSRELVRNNAYAARAMQAIQTNVVGKGIRPAITHPTQSIEDRIKEEWARWAGTPACDYDGVYDYYGLQSLVIRSIAESGEVLVRKRRVRREGQLSVQLQVLESDFLASDRIFSSVQSARPNEGNRIIQGIEFNPKGKRVAYHLYETHPGNMGIDSGTAGTAFKIIRIPAEEIRHIYRVDRPGQLRGVPWLSPVMLRLKDFDEYEQAQLLRQKLAACYMGFIKDTEISELDDEERALISKFEPGLIEFLPPGKDITLASPPEVSENYEDYTRVMLQAVAAGIGISYEAMTGNLKDINFSSSRMGWLEFQRNIETWRMFLMNTQLNDPAYTWFAEAAELEGLPAEQSGRTWTAPRREMIDPAKEVPALVDAVNNGMKTLSEVVRENGKNPEDHFKELAAEQAELDRLGIKLETKGNSQTNNVDSSKNSGKVSESNSKA